MPPDLSLVIPCYNESSHLRESAARLLATLDGSRLDYEVVFIDDSSSDDTRAILTEICGDHRTLTAREALNEGGRVTLQSYEPGREPAPESRVVPELHVMPLPEGDALSEEDARY